MYVDYCLCNDISISVHIYVIFTSAHLHDIHTSAHFQDRFASVHIHDIFIRVHFYDIHTFQFTYMINLLNLLTLSSGKRLEISP